MASQALAVGKGFARWMRLVRFLYPCVPRISSDKLQHLINDEECAKKLVLLDIREPEEIEVSRIPDSIHISPSTKDMNTLLSAINSKVPDDKPKTVVLYCAIGWRASIMADSLMIELAKPENHGIRKKINLSILEGSMFKWGNERRVLIGGKDNGQTNLVHGVSGAFEKLLNEDVRAKR